MNEEIAGWPKNCHHFPDMFSAYILQSTDFVSFD